jgi:PhnB protein
MAPESSENRRDVMPPIYPDVIPMIAYEHGPQAMDWLADAFGFKERARMTDSGGRLSHGEMQAGDGVIMLATPSPDYRGPKTHRDSCEQARKWSSVPYIIDGVLVYVEDVHAHFERARKAGANILSEPTEDSNGKQYRVEDLEGHRWMFMQKVNAASARERS